MQFGFILMSRNVNVYGKMAMAVYGIGNKVNGLISLPSTGIGSAVSTIVAQNMGSAAGCRAERGYKLSTGMALLFLLLGGFVLSRPSVASAIVSIFTDEAEVIPMAADYLSIMAFWCLEEQHPRCDPRSVSREWTHISARRSGYDTPMGAAFRDPRIL